MPKQAILLVLSEQEQSLCWLLPSVHRILLPLLLEMRDVPCSCLTLCVIALGTSVERNRERANLCLINRQGDTLATRQKDDVFSLFMEGKQGETQYTGISK